jgi:hypothetical protein
MRGAVPGTGRCQPGRFNENARKNLQEAVELFLEAATPSEMEQRSHSEVFVTRLEVEVGKAPRSFRAQRSARFSPRQRILRRLPQKAVTSRCRNVSPAPQSRSKFQTLLSTLLSIICQIAVAKSTL